MSAVRFIHTSDLHLGSPLETESGTVLNVKERINHSTYTALERIVEWTLEKDVDFLLFSGDIYDRESRSVKANRFLVVQFTRLVESGIPVFLIYGNHDPMEIGHEFFSFPDGVTVFPSDDAGQEVVEKEGYREKDCRHSRFLFLSA